MKAGTKTRRPGSTASRFAVHEGVLPPIRVRTLMPKRILAPVDFTACSMKAVTYAVSLAKHFRSEIILLHIAKLVMPAPAPDLVALRTDMLDAQLFDDAAKQLSQWLGQVAACVPTRALVRTGVSVDEEIVATARKSNCDLIVMSIQPKGALEHLFTGSVAEKVVRHAPCPVFVVREQENDFIETRRNARSVRRKTTANRGQAVQRGKKTPRTQIFAQHPEFLERVG
jgi:universal stress protein A